MGNKIQSRIERANQLLPLLLPNSGSVAEIKKWTIILERFPITKLGKVKLINRAKDRGVLMGIAVDHLMSVAGIIGIPQVYIKDLSQTRHTWKNTGKRHGQNNKSNWDYTFSPYRQTKMLLDATYKKVLQLE